MKKWMMLILAAVAIAGSGFLAAFLACQVNGVPFGFFVWPLIGCVDIFAFSTVGFFSTEGKTEVLYGFCSIAGAACAVVQLAILF